MKLGLCGALSCAGVSEMVVIAFPCQSCADVSMMVAMALPYQSCSDVSRRYLRLCGAKAQHCRANKARRPRLRLALS